MQNDVFCGDIKLGLQTMNEGLQLRELAVGEWPAIAVANEADADGVLILLSGEVGFAWHVSARLLLVPAVADVNDAIAKAVAVADQEVVTETLVAHADVLALYGFRIACGLAQMVHDDAGPALAIERLGDLKNRIDGGFGTNRIEGGEEEAGLGWSVLNGD